MRTHAHTYNSKETVFHCKRLRLPVAGVAFRFSVTPNNNSNKSFADHSFPAALDASLWKDTHTTTFSALQHFGNPLISNGSNGGQFNKLSNVRILTCLS